MDRPHGLWFTAAESCNAIPVAAEDGALNGGWGMSSVDATEFNQIRSNPYLNGDPNQVVPLDQLPFTRLKPPPEGEDMDTIQTVQAWVVDIPDQRQITNMLKWLKQAELDTPDLVHLKRIRKQGDTTTFLLATSAIPPTLPEHLPLSEPYTLRVPASSALTLKSLELKNTLWPTVYAPSRKDGPEEWSRGKASWAWEAMAVAITAASEALKEGELPIAAHVGPSYESNGNPLSISFTAHDTRNSTAHPLRHAVLNVVRCMADYHVDLPTRHASSPELRDLQNGRNYLLTSLSLFTTHEPCIMCSMALLHSRVKEVFYLHAMPKTGGCGGIACLPTLKGVNHRFGICHWGIVDDIATRIRIEDSIDA